MDYEIKIANGVETENMIIVNVLNVDLEDGAYSFYNKDRTLLFSSPVDSVVYVIKLK